MQAILVKYSDKCFINLTNNLCEVKDFCTIDSVHKLRLTIKKLYTLFGILGYLEEIPAVKKDLKLIDQVFIKSGLLRDNQIHIEFLKLYQSRIGVEVDFIIEMFKVNIKKHKESVRRKIKRINPFDLVLLNQRLDNAIEELNDASIENILHSNVKELFNHMKGILESEPDEKVWHRVRIILKQLIDTLSIIRKVKRKDEYDLSRITLLKSLQQKLGEWHDLKVLYNSILDLEVEAPSLINAIEFDKKTKLINAINDLSKLEGLKLIE